MERERGNHLQIRRRRLSRQHSAREHSAVEIQQRLFHQPRIAAHRVGEQHLQPRVHDELQLLVIRAIHVGLHHAVAQGAQADIPKLPHPRRRGRDAGFNGQGIARPAIDGPLGELPAADDDISKGSHPEGLIAEGPPVQDDMVGAAGDAAVQIVDALAVRSIPEPFQIGDRDLRARFSCEGEAGVPVDKRSRIQNDLLSIGKDAVKVGFYLFHQRYDSWDHVDPGHYAHALKGRRGHHRPPGQGRPPGRGVKTGCFPVAGGQAKTDVLLHRAQIDRIGSGLEIEGVVQPDAPVRPTGGDAADALSVGSRNIAFYGQRVTVARADHAVNGGARVRLIFGNIRVVEQHLHGKDVFSRPQIGRQLHRFIILPVQIALAGAGQHALAIDPQPIAGDCRDTGGQAGVPGQRLLASETGEATAQIAVIDALLRQLFGRNPDPLG